MRYTARYSPKDGFRLGNYGILNYTIGNIGLDFLPSLTHKREKSMVRRLHLENRHPVANTNSARWRYREWRDAGFDLGISYS
jgi:hypothetical protein